MTAQEKIKEGEKVQPDTPAPTGLELLRAPFPAHQISKLPKPTAAQTKAVKDDFKAGIRCQICGTWHHPKVVHLDYVGHAALTDRLLDCDPEWNWEPVAINEDGTPKRDSIGGMWIRLTVCGVTRLGYGDAEGKTGGNAVKELIGDALRNAAMRFGAALDLWHKGTLHEMDEPEDSGDVTEKPKEANPEAQAAAVESLKNAESLDQLKAIWTELPLNVQSIPAVITAKDARKAELTTAPRENADLGEDAIPY